MIPVYIILAVMAFIMILPFVWTLLTAFKTQAEALQVPPRILPSSWSPRNFESVLQVLPFGKFFYNTFAMIVLRVLGSVFFSALAAFAFARLQFAGRDLVFTLFLALMMIPGELVVITNFATITNLELRNTFTGLILPSVTSVFYIYLLRENFAQIPDELYYAAKVDGTSDFRYLRRVMIPICRPTLVTITILKIIECWNSYVWPRLITDDANYYLVSNGIQEIRENGFGRANIPAMMAAVVVISLPLILLFLLFRRQIMSGIARGGTKG